MQVCRLMYVKVHCLLDCPGRPTNLSLTVVPGGVEDTGTELLLPGQVLHSTHTCQYYYCQVFGPGCSSPTTPGLLQCAVTCPGHQQLSRLLNPDRDQVTLLA